MDTNQFLPRSLPGFKSRLDFNSIQSGHTFGSDSYAFVSKDYALTPAKPTVDMEPAYENHPTGANQPRVDAHKVRTQAYSANQGTREFVAPSHGDQDDWVLVLSILP